MMLELRQRVGAVSGGHDRPQPGPVDARAAGGASRTASNADEIEMQFICWELVVRRHRNEKAIQDGLGRVGPGGTFLRSGWPTTRPARRSIRTDLQQEITITGSMAVLPQLRARGRPVRLRRPGPQGVITDRSAGALPRRDRGVQERAGLKTQVLPNAGSPE